jgi:hypothetical protein
MGCSWSAKPWRPVAAAWSGDVRNPASAGFWNVRLAETFRSNVTADPIAGLISPRPDRSRAAVSRTSGRRRTPTRRPGLQRTVSFALGAETRRVLAWALGFGSSRNRV